MNIVIDGRMILPQMIGVGRYLLGLVRAMHAVLETAGGDDHLELWLQARLPENHPAWQLAGERVALRPLPLAHMDLRQQWVAPELLRRSRPDLFHHPHFDLPLAVPGRVVATIHDLKYIARPDFFPQQGRAKRLLMLAMMAFTVRRAGKIIAVSQSTRNDLCRFLGANPHKIVVIPEGVEPDYFITPPVTATVDVCRRYGITGPFVLFVGERRPHKNIDGLIRAFAVFRRMAPQAYQLVVVGKRYAGYQEPERLVEALGVGASIRFLDYVPEADLRLLYHAAEVFSLLSHYEGFGLPVLEAMAAGVPVVAAQGASLPEVGGPAAVYVAANELEQAAAALRQVIVGGEKREACIAAGLANARQFTWERSAAATLELYRQALV